MQIEVSCPSCGSTFNVDEQNIGKTGKCAKCGSRVRIERSQLNYALPPVARPVSAPPVADDWPADWPTGEQLPAPLATKAPTPIVAKSPPPPKAAENQSSNSFKQFFTTDHRLPRFALMGCVLACLIVGYFAGREHLKYELRSIVEDSGKEIAQSFAQGWQKGLKNAFGGSSEVAAPEPTDSVIEFGQVATAPGLQIAINDARIDQPKMQSTADTAPTPFEQSCVLITLTVKNTDDRNILRYNSSGMFAGGAAQQLQDDVKNVIRSMNFGSFMNFVGALNGSEDILPGTQATHLLVFNVPPPKTKYLVLTVDLASFGSEGKAAFKIPVERIANFPK